MRDPRPLLVAALVFACVACVPPTTVVESTLPPSFKTETCTPTDQDAYVYRPARLGVMNPCLRVTGTIVSMSVETDGDVHIDVKLDPPYLGMLNAGNDEVGGALVVEPVCQVPPLAADAIRICAADPDPLATLPTVGAHIWLEGRHVLDLQHFSWVELHPLYRWGVAP